MIVIEWVVGLCIVVGANTLWLIQYEYAYFQVNIKLEVWYGCTDVKKNKQLLHLLPYNFVNVCPGNNLYESRILCELFIGLMSKG